MQASDGMALDRRALLRSAILLVGGSAVAMPADLFAQGSAPVPATKRFFTPGQFATLAEVAEIILPETDTPGAREAGVPQALDALMTNWASPKRQAQFRALIDDIDRTAVVAGGALPKLAMDKRVDLVRAYDEAKFAANDSTYRRFKELVMTLYYSSEIGATRELRYELIPGKWEPGIEMAADTRAWAF